jgi:hypothetical protein
MPSVDAQVDFLQYVPFMQLPLLAHESVRLPVSATTEEASLAPERGVSPPGVEAS